MPQDGLEDPRRHNLLSRMLNGRSGAILELKTITAPGDDSPGAVRECCNMAQQQCYVSIHVPGLTETKEESTKHEIRHQPI